MLYYNSNLVHINSSDTDPMLYWKRILDIIHFEVILFLGEFFHTGICFCCCILLSCDYHLYAFDVTDGCCYSILPLETTNVILLSSHLSSISATPLIQLQSLNAIIKVNKITPWLFSEKLNTPLRRKTQAPDSHRWSPLP